MTPPSWEQYLSDHLDANQQDLVDLLRIPSISTDKEHAGDVRRAAEWVRDRMLKAGIPEAEVVEKAGGHPIVLGSWIVDPAQPTALIYGHYDVQPAVPLELWESPPFEPAIRGDKLYARGASDMKANLLTTIHAVEAFARTTGQPPINIKFFFEGEEEIGSPNLEAWVEANKERLACDFVLSADSGMDGPTAPVLVTTLKGITGCQIDIRTGETDLHSGGFGAAVPNANQVIAQLAATFHTPDGKVGIEGFYDTVRPLTDDDKADIKQGDPATEQLLANSGEFTLWGEEGYTPGERIAARPTLDINGLWGGYTGDGMKTVTPAEAHLKLTCRLVPDQDPLAILELIKAHVAKHIYPGTQFTISALNGGAYPFAISKDHPAMKKLFPVLTALYGNEPTYAHVGASVPVTGIFQQVLKADTVELGFSQPGSGAHAPNEWWLVSDLLLGQRVYCAALEALAN